MKNFATCIFMLILFTAARAQSPHLDSLQRIVAQHRGDTIEVLALDNIASEYMRNDMEKALYYTRLELRLAKLINYENGISRAYGGLIPLHQSTGHLDSAQYYVDQFEALYKKNLRPRTGINYNNSVGLFYKNQGKFTEALPHLVEALRLIGPNGNKTFQAGQLLNIGNVEQKLGHMTSAAAYHIKSLSLFEEVGNKRGQSFCLQGLGGDYYELGQYAAAEKYLRQSAKMKQELGDKRGVVSSWQTIANIYQRQQKPELSLEYSRKALELARELNLIIEQKEIWFNIGSLLKNQKKPEDARKAFDESMKFARQTGDSLVAKRIHSELILMNNDLSKEQHEETVLHDNIKISLERGAKSQSAEGYFKLADWYANHRQFEKAFEFLKKAGKFNDSIRGGDVIVEMKRLEEVYQNEKKEKEIALLKKDQELSALALDRQKAVITSIIIALIGLVVIGLLLVNRYRVINKAKRLVEIERVRNTIARDLHDDIGSTLSSINILSKVALIEKNGNANNYLQRIGDQSSRMMDDISDIVWSINPHNDSMRQVLIRMREFSTEIFDPTNITWNFHEQIDEHLTLDSDKRKNLFLIFKESVNNAAKYSEASEVEISLQKSDHMLVMIVKDNGKGFDEATVRTGNGLRNLRERAREVKGDVKLISKVSSGTTVELRLPLA